MVPPPDWPLAAIRVRVTVSIRAKIKVKVSISVRVTVLIRIRVKVRVKSRFLSNKCLWESNLLRLGLALRVAVGEC